jgi:hypothetical protein
MVPSLVFNPYLVVAGPICYKWMSLENVTLIKEVRQNTMITFSRMGKSVETGSRLVVSKDGRREDEERMACVTGFPLEL